MAEERKKFTVPSKDEVIIEIKALEQEIEHVSLNLVRCHFDATEADVKKAFPDYNLLKIKNYKPGSFEVVFEIRMDAIEFIRSCYDKRILGRRFFIKLGRQSKDIIQDWTGVGYVPKSFKQNRNFQNKGYPRKSDQGEKVEDKPDNEETKEAQKQQPNRKQEGVKIEAPKEEKTVPDQDTKKQPEVKKGITIETKTEERKKRAPRQEKEPRQQKAAEPVKQEASRTQAPKKTEEVEKKKRRNPKVDQEKHKEVQEPKEGEDDGWIVVPTTKKEEVEKKKRRNPKADQEKRKEVQEPKEDEDDGWIVVPTTKKGRKK